MAKKRPVPPAAVYGIAWYRADEWPQLLAASVDREDLEDTHAEWLAGAKRTFVELAAQGVPVKKVDVGVAELIEWCRKQRRPVDSSARSAYAAFKLQRSHSKS